MRKALLIGMVGCLLGLGSMASAAEIRVGYVNLQRVKDTDEWKRFEELFKTEVTTSQLEVEQRKSELENAARQYGRQKSMLSESAQREKERELQKQRLEFQLWAQERQRDLETKRDEMSQQIWSRVNEAVEKVAREKRLTLVVDYNPNAPNLTLNFEKGLVYVDPKTDITDEVLKVFNEMSGGQ